MTRALAYVRRDPGGALLLLALVLAAAIYAPALGHGLSSYDDPWLVGGNWVLQAPHAGSLHTVFCDLASPARIALGAEYLPVRDLSVMADFVVWGHWWGGFHLTNLILYEAAIALWFAAFVRFGVPRTIAGLAVLLWALHPTHAESVAWLAERKGLLGALFAGACALGYAKFRSGPPFGGEHPGPPPRRPAPEPGGRARWLGLAIACGVLAVWSKATAAFGVAALGGLELALPARRVAWRRSLGALAAICVAAGAAYVPVVIVATRFGVVGDAALPASRAAMIAGVHGFYAKLAALAMPNAIAYPIAQRGPSAGELVLGIAAFGAIGAALVLRRTPPMVRAGAAVWLIAYLPVSQAIAPLAQVVVADRYLLLPTLGLALAVAAGIAAIPNRRLGAALAAAIALASAARAIDAQAAWASPVALWARATESSPTDGAAWAHYVEALDESGRRDLARAALADGLAHSHAPRLVMHQALLLDEDGDHAGAMAAMRRAADAGDARAMANLAKWLLDAGQLDAALAYARRAPLAEPGYANGHRMHGKVALAAGLRDEARAAFERAYAIEPSAANAYNLRLVRGERMPDSH